MHFCRTRKHVTWLKVKSWFRVSKTFDRSINIEPVYPFLSKDVFQFSIKALYLGKWKDEACNNVGMTKDEQSRLCLSKQTQFGWQFTGIYIY